MTQLGVVIPIYNAFEEAERCLRSVHEHSSDVPVIVIDDCSPEGEFEKWMRERGEVPEQIAFYRNQENLGYAGACNRGLELLGDADAILLNSDTEVTSDWISKLKRAAYSSDKVGSVTPLTNNGMICSVPRFCEDNFIPDGYSLSEFASLVEEVSQAEYPEIPTAVGFCMYVRRSVLSEVGVLDSQAFSQGYGEENELSCRIRQAGYSNIIDDSTFIFHQGEASFAGRQAELYQPGADAITKRYPHYFDEIARFCAANPLRPIQDRVHRALVRNWSEKSEGTMLHVLHNGPFVSRGDPLGGVEQHVQELILRSPQFAHWSLVAVPGKYYLTAHTAGFDKQYVFDADQTSLLEIIKDEFFSLVHLHHSRWFPHEELCLALQNHGSYFVSLHDFVLGCPRFHLLTPKREHCNGHECSSACGYAAERISQQRKSSLEVLQNSEQNFCFSQNTVQYLEKLFREPITATVLPHGIDEVLLQDFDQDEKAAQDEGVLRVLLLGALPPHKGGELVDKLILRKNLPCGKQLEWHVLGDERKSSQPNVFVHGRYKRESLGSKIKKISPHLALFVSLCPETYSLTVDEALAARVPVLVGPLGAPQERVQQWNVGWVFDELSEEGILWKLDAIAKDRDSYLAVFHNLKDIPLSSLEEMSKRYTAEYKPRTSPVRIELLLSFLDEMALTYDRNTSLFRRVVGGLVNQGIYLLDSLHIRRKLETVIYRVVPEQILNRLKNLRRSAVVE